MTDHALPSDLRVGTLPTESWRPPNSSICRREEGLSEAISVLLEIRGRTGVAGRDTQSLTLSGLKIICLWPSRCSLTLKSLVAPNQTSASSRGQSRAQGDAGQVVPNEQWEETREGPPTEEASRAEEQAAQAGTEGCLLPLPSSG